MYSSVVFLGKTVSQRYTTWSCVYYVHMSTGFKVSVWSFSLRGLAQSVGSSFSFVAEDSSQVAELLQGISVFWSYITGSEWKVMIPLPQHLLSLLWFGVEIWSGKSHRHLPNGYETTGHNLCTVASQYSYYFMGMLNISTTSCSSSAVASHFVNCFLLLGLFFGLCLILGRKHFLFRARSCRSKGQKNQGFFSYMLSHPHHSVVLLVLDQCLYHCSAKKTKNRSHLFDMGLRSWVRASDVSAEDTDHCGSSP